MADDADAIVVGGGLAGLVAATEIADAGKRVIVIDQEGEQRDWLRAMGHRIFPVVGWAERGGYDAMGHGNSVPRFHVTWGTGPGIVEPFERRAREAQSAGRLTFRFRHRVDALMITGGTVEGISGVILEPD